MRVQIHDASPTFDQKEPLFYNSDWQFKNILLNNKKRYRLKAPMIFSNHIFSEVCFVIARYCAHSMTCIQFDDFRRSVRQTRLNEMSRIPSRFHSNHNMNTFKTVIPFFALRLFHRFKSAAQNPMEVSLKQATQAKEDS